MRFKTYSSGAAFLGIKQATPGAPHAHASTEYPDHNHGGETSLDGNHSHNTDYQSNTPPYKKAGFITALSEQELPDKGIFAWEGLLSEIPAGFVLCNGRMNARFPGVFYTRNYQ
jgi:hypothetical protein